MKKLIQQALFGVAGVALGVAPALAGPAGSWPPAAGDVILGFQATAGTGSNTNVFYNLGPGFGFRDDTAQGNLANLDTILSDTFGDDWFTRTDLYFGAIANRSPFPTSGIGSVPAENGDPSRTFYVSRAAGTNQPGAAIVFSGFGSPQLGTAGQTLAGQYTMLAGLSATGGVAVLPSSDSVSFANGWTAWNPFLNGGQAIAYKQFGGGIQNSFGKGGPVYVDLHRVQGDTGDGTYQTTIAITETGDVVVAQSFFTLTLTAPTNGSVSGAASGDFFGDGEEATLTPTPATGYVFSSWTGVPAGDETDNPLILVMDANKTVAAVFSKDNADTDGDGISNHDELVIHNTNPAVANTYTGPLAGAPFTTPNGETVNFEGTLSLGGAEISAFDPASQRLFVTSGAGLQVVDLSNPAVPALLSTINLSVAPFSAVSNDISSVAVSNGVVAASCLNANKEAAGSVVFLTAATAGVATGHISTIAVGLHPDHVVFTPNGQKLLVANEGEYLDSNGGPGVTPGSVSIIDVSGGFGAPPVLNVGFTSFDAQVAALKAAGVRIFGSELPSNDLEPENIAVSPDSTQALVTLQENNAVAILNLVTNTFTGIVPLGTKDFSTLLADFSDRDGPGNSAISLLQSGSPMKSLFMPDGVASFTQGGQTFYVTANEGDDRDDFLASDETSRVSGLTLDGTAFPNAATLQTNAVLGRHTVTTIGANGDALASPVTELLSIGARSFSIWDSTGTLVYDSGDLIERTVASYGKDDAGLGGTTQAIFDDTRSDNKGPEPEGVAVAEINGTLYAFVTLERSNGVMVFDITDTNSVTVQGFLRGVNDISPEGVIIVPAVSSPNNKTLVVVSNEVSNTISVFSFDADTTTDSDNNGFSDFQEAQLAALIANPFQVGQTVTLDIGSIMGFPLPAGQTLAVSGLPPGLKYTATTGLITGTITAESGATVGAITLRQGSAVGSVKFDLTVIPFQLLGSFEALIENAGLPIGKARLTVTGPRAYTAVLDMQGQPTRRVSGRLSANVTSPFVVNFAAGRGGVPAATSVSFTVSPSTDLVSGSAGLTPVNTGLGTLRGFRLVKAGRSPLQRVTVALENDVDGDRLLTPAGTGFASGSLNGAGLLSLRGFLGDAVALTTGLNLSQTNQAVVFVQPYKDKASSFFGGIITIGDLGQPSRGASTEVTADGLQWRKAALATEKAYAAGFGIATPLDVTGRVSRWIPVTTAEGLALSLGLSLREVNASYIAPTADVYPSTLALRNNFSLVRLLPTNSVASSGRATASSGLFSGTLTLPAPAARTTVSGVFLQDESFGTLIGVGFVRIPGAVAGSYTTAGIQYDND